MNCLKKTKVNITCTLLLVFLLVGHAIKLFIFFKDGIISRDSAFYINVAQIWFQSDDFDAILAAYPFFHTPPLFIYITKSFLSRGIDPFLGDVSLNIVCGDLLIITTYKITHIIFKKRSIALLSSILILFHPTINHLSVEALREMPYLLASSVAMICFLYGFNRFKVHYWVYAGWLCGISFLFRYEALELLIVGCLLPAVHYLLYKNKSFVSYTVFCEALFLLSFSCIIFIAVFLLDFGKHFSSIYFDYIFGRLSANL